MQTLDIYMLDICSPAQIPPIVTMGKFSFYNNEFDKWPHF